MSTIRCAIAAIVAGAAATVLSSAPRAEQRPVFRSDLNVISVDVIVRDRSGAVVRGLTAADFEVKEDGRAQQVASFSFVEITENALPALATAELLAGVEARMAGDASRSTGPPAARPAPDAAAAPMTSDMLAGRRLIALVFDVSSMQPEDVQRAVDSARKYVDEKMTAADLVAVATVGSMLSVLTDFTSDRARIGAALGTLAFTDGTATDAPAGVGRERGERVLRCGETAELPADAAPREERLAAPARLGGIAAGHDRLQATRVDRVNGDMRPNRRIHRGTQLDLVVLSAALHTGTEIDNGLLLLEWRQGFGQRSQRAQPDVVVEHVELGRFRARGLLGRRGGRFVHSRGRCRARWPAARRRPAPPPAGPACRWDR